MNTVPLTRRRLLARLGVAASAAVGWRVVASAQANVPIVVYKSPTCGCCHQWVAHMNANGFAATVKDMADVNPIKHEHGIVSPLWSCHTAVVGAYVIEGHVPAADVKKLLVEKPKGIVGLTIPGMPASAPGMDMKPFQPYTVLTFDRTGRTTVFVRHERA